MNVGNTVLAIVFLQEKRRNTIHAREHGIYGNNASKMRQVLNCWNNVYDLWQHDVATKVRQPKTVSMTVVSGLKSSNSC
jgi:hypothetical protein